MIHVIEKVQKTVPAPPPVVAISGILFAVLFVASIILIRLTVPADPTDPGVWISDPVSRRWVLMSLNLVPFAGLAFLWFMAVLRNHIGMREDRFFATVFLGSGLLFVAMLFASVAVAQGLMVALSGGEMQLADSEGYRVGRGMAHALMNTFGMRMAAVFMCVTSMIGVCAGVLPGPLVLTGFAFGLVLLLVITDFAWIVLLFPLWVMLVSTYVLVVNLRTKEDDRT